MNNRRTMKYRVLKTEGGKKVLKALKICIKKGKRTLNMGGMDEREKMKKKREKNE